MQNLKIQKYFWTCRRIRHSKNTRAMNWSYYLMASNLTNSSTLTLKPYHLKIPTFIWDDFGMIIKPALLENLLPLSLLSLGFSTAAASVYLKRILWTSNIGRWPSLISKFMSLVSHQPIWLWQRMLNIEYYIIFVLIS